MVIKTWSIRENLVISEPWGSPRMWAPPLLALPAVPGPMLWFVFQGVFYGASLYHASKTNTADVLGRVEGSWWYQATLLPSCPASQLPRARLPGARIPGPSLPEGSWVRDFLSLPEGSGARVFLRFLVWAFLRVPGLESSWGFLGSSFPEASRVSVFLRLPGIQSSWGFLK